MSTGPKSPTPTEQQASSGQGPGSGHDFVVLDKSPEFWPIIAYAALSGVVLAFASLAFLGLLKGGTNGWFTLPRNPDWFSGSLWWVAVTAAAGVLVGVLRHVLRLPAKVPGTIKELKDERSDPSNVFQVVVVSLVGLVGGASLGPEGALGKLGGGFGTWVSERRKLDADTSATNTLSGMAAAFGGMLSSPILASALVIEVARPRRGRLGDTFVAALVSSTVAFAIYYPIAGSTFLGVYAVPPFRYHDWYLAAAVPLGLVAAALALIVVVAIGLLSKLAAPLAERRPILLSTLGGIVFGLVGVVLPLTLFTGTSQLTVVIHRGAELGVGLVIAVVFAKILTFALCEATGFIGGPVLVTLFIGGTAGIAVHLLIPGLPEGLAFATMFAAILAALLAAPFTLIVMAALLIRLGALELAPVAVAVVTAYLAVSGSGVLMALIQKARTSAKSSSEGAAQPSPRVS